MTIAEVSRQYGLQCMFFSAPNLLETSAFIN